MMNRFHMSMAFIRAMEDRLDLKTLTKTAETIS